MKTQISNLVNGNSTTGIAGTNRIDRSAIAEKVILENQDSLKIQIKGLTFNLTAKWSLSRKTVTYIASITQEQYIKLLGSNYCLSTKNPVASIEVQGDMTVQVQTKTGFNYLNESDVTIL